MSYRLYHVTFDKYYSNPFEKDTTFSFDNFEQVSMYMRAILVIHNDCAIPATQAHAKWIEEEFVIIEEFVKAT